MGGVDKTTEKVKKLIFVLEEAEKYEKLSLGMIKAVQMLEDYVNNGSNQIRATKI